VGVGVGSGVGVGVDVDVGAGFETTFTEPGSVVSLPQAATTAASAATAMYRRLALRIWERIMSSLGGPFVTFRYAKSGYRRINAITAITRRPAKDKRRTLEVQAKTDLRVDQTDKWRRACHGQLA
jgi:hypothetical protein